MLPIIFEVCYDFFMNDILNDINTDFEDSSTEETSSNDSHIKFNCPKCGELSRDDVLFLCNTCDSTELEHTDGMYICPQCLVPGENFECLSCGSKEVTMKAAN